MDRKKELLMEYKQRKREMGVFLFECAEGGRYIGRADDPKGAINKNVFQLKIAKLPIEAVESTTKAPMSASQSEAAEVRESSGPSLCAVVPGCAMSPLIRHAGLGNLSGLCR